MSTKSNHVEKGPSREALVMALQQAKCNQDLKLMLTQEGVVFTGQQSQAPFKLRSLTNSGDYAEYIISGEFWSTGEKFQLVYNVHTRTGYFAV